MMFKLMSVLLVITVQSSIANPIGENETYRRLGWDVQRMHCGAALEQIVDLVCQGAVEEAMKMEIGPNRITEPACCKTSCTLGELKLQYCIDKSADNRTHIDVPLKKPAAAINTPVSPPPTTKPAEQWLYGPNMDFLRFFYSMIMPHYVLFHPMPLQISQEQGINNEQWINPAVNLGTNTAQGI